MSLVFYIPSLHDLLFITQQSPWDSVAERHEFSPHDRKALHNKGLRKIQIT